MMQKAVSRRASVSVFLILAIGFAVYAAQLGPDANWDLRNYHLYAPFALLHGKLSYDIAPAQIQTYLAPQLDLIGYVALHFLNAHPALLNAVMSLPTALEAFLAFLISCRFLPQGMAGRVPLAVIITLIGATGAAGLPTLSTSMSESIPGSLVLAGLLAILTAHEAQRPALRLALAALLLGISTGLKLTNIPFCLGGAAAVLVTPVAPARAKWCGFLLFGAMGVLSVTLIAAPWWIMLYTKFQSPLFPFFNQIFHSPDYFSQSITDNRFQPHSVLQALFYPFYWLMSSTPKVTEIPMRDPRFAASVVLLGSATFATIIARGRDRAAVAMVLAFFLVSYVAWEKAFSIFRYLAPLEMLTGTTILVAWRAFQPQGSKRWIPWIGTALLAGLCLSLTKYPDWGRASQGPKAVNVQVPRLPAGSLVILLDSSPMAYVAAFEPPDVRFVGANSNLLAPGQKTELNHQAEAAIRTAKGPLWGLEYYPAAATTDDATLKYYGLHRVSPCLTVISNLDANSLRLCALARNRAKP
ncbi:MAG TPA: hypothetical protein VL752_00785 [Acidisoma sp.]|uniref:hypothetical protein n=1 Tax=Acidisoma sp. TaxID=1872115 RepID=UPI002C62CFDC|nr:hypothetical protein [Acidisoma sp.]HTH99451.1 hypothetical protein [Acidisoma sp.]